jgi:DNA-binding NarL/FixJ family response regulator
MLAEMDADLQWPTRFLIVDDSASTRRFLRTVLECCPKFEVVGEADNGATAISIATALQPDVVLLDLSMPVVDGADALADLRRVAPNATVIVLSAADPQRAASLLASGATAFISKGLPPFELLEELGAILAAGDRLRDVLQPTCPSVLVDVPRTIDVPRLPEAPKNPDAVVPPAAPSPASAIRAVVCDDDAVSRHLVGQVLANTGLVVIAETDCVANLLSVIELTHPDVVVLDLWLEGTTGTSALPEIRCISPRTVVIVYSSYAEYEGKALAAGAAAFVAKPHFDQLAQQIERLTSFATR